MCVRALADRLAMERWRAKYGVRAARRMMAEQYGESSPGEIFPGEIFPGDQGVIALPGPEGTELEIAAWGLQPKWAKERAFGRKNAYNARAETLLEKPTFREPFRRRRCLVPLGAFYERADGRWLLVSPADGEPFAAAGLWEPQNHWSELPTFTMVTTTPNEVIGEVHDRMPVILDPEDYAAWLDPKIPAEELRGLLVPARPEAFRIEDAGPVGKPKKAEEPPSLFD